MNEETAKSLLLAGLVGPEALARALHEQEQKGGTLTAHLLDVGAISEDGLLDFLSKLYGVPSIDLRIHVPDATLTRLLPADVATRFMVLPVARRGQTLVVAMANPSNIFAIDDIKFITGCDVETRVALESALRAALERCYGTVSGPENTIEPRSSQHPAMVTTAADASIVKLVNALIVEAARRGASEIHVEPGVGRIVVWLSVKGSSLEMLAPPLKFLEPMISRIKVMADLAPSRRDTTQEGTFKVNALGHVFDMRVMSVPLLRGEKVIVLVLGNQPNTQQLPTASADSATQGRFAEPSGYSEIVGMARAAMPPDQSAETRDEPRNFAVPLDRVEANAQGEVLVSNLEDLTRHYFDETDALLARRVLAGRWPSKFRRPLRVLLRDHKTMPIHDAREVELRGAFDELLNFYSHLSIAGLAGLLPDPLPDRLKATALRDLRRRPLRDYYEGHYPILLPKVLRLGLERGSLRAQHAGGEWSSYSEFLDISSTIESDPHVETFLWFLDDGYIGDFNLESLNHLMDNPSRFLARLCRERPKDALDRALRGFREFLIFCVRLDGLLNRQDTVPVIASAYWHYHAYWFEQLRTKVDEVLDTGLKKISEWQVESESGADDGGESLRSIEDLRAVCRRLTSGDYGIELRARLRGLESE